MEKLKHIKECLLSSVMNEIGHIDTVDYKELGAAIDMIKDLSEATYYCSIVEAMEKKEDEPRYYMPIDYNYAYRDSDRQYGRMFYNGNGNSSNSSGTSHDNGGSNTSGYNEMAYPQVRLAMRDSREGRSPVSRRSYMEAKEMHQEKMVKMKELEKYVHELGQDLTEMISDASPEEKQLLSKKIAALAAKIDV